MLKRIHYTTITINSKFLRIVITNTLHYTILWTWPSECVPMQCWDFASSYTHKCYFSCHIQKLFQNKWSIAHGYTHESTISSVRRQKGLTCYHFKCIDRPFCPQADDMSLFTEQRMRLSKWQLQQWKNASFDGSDMIDLVRAFHWCTTKMNKWFINNQ